MTASVAEPMSVGLARLTAVLVLASAATHLLLVSASSLGALVMAAMAMACLPCAWQLWRSPSPATWRMTAAIDAGMLALHVPMLTAPHQHGATASLMWLAFALVVTQLGCAATAAIRRY